MLLAFAAACAVTPMRGRPLLRIVVWSWVIGAALATFLSFGLMMVWTYAWSQRLYPVPFDHRRTATVLVIAGSCYAIAWIADRASGAFTAPGYMIRILAVAAYPVALVLVGFFADEGIHRLQDLPAGIERLPRSAPGGKKPAS